MAKVGSVGRILWKGAFGSEDIRASQPILIPLTIALFKIKIKGTLG
jgi:hypothetical protein